MYFPLALSIPTFLTTERPEFLSFLKILKSKSKNIEKIVIPDYIEGLKVSRIKQGAFKHLSRLKEIELNGFITELPDDCFSDCTKLEKINMKNINK